MPAVQKWGSWKGGQEGKKWHHYSRWQSQRGSQMGNNNNITNETSYFLCMTDFEIIKKNTRKFNTRVIILKLQFLLVVAIVIVHLGC
jgi:hypothetical protein